MHDYNISHHFLPAVIESTIKLDAISPSTEVSYVNVDVVEDVIASYQEQLTPLLIKRSDFVMDEEIGQGVHQFV